MYFLVNGLNKPRHKTSKKEIRVLKALAFPKLTNEPWTDIKQALKSIMPRQTIQTNKSNSSTRLRNLQTDPLAPTINSPFSTTPKMPARMTAPSQQRTIGLLDDDHSSTTSSQDSSNSPNVEYPLPPLPRGAIRSLNILLAEQVELNRRQREVDNSIRADEVPAQANDGTRRLQAIEEVDGLVEWESQESQRRRDEVKSNIKATTKPLHADQQVGSQAVRYPMFPHSLNTPSVPHPRRGTPPDHPAWRTYYNQFRNELQFQQNDWVLPPNQETRGPRKMYSSFDF
ncbi:hypothetical protein DL98DRAFT_532561 [Cadophora sp. DSE1049]|nr:hypothetical protein DL98DRAFT_532561 [Cadophora sp. DSE1049]